jgi:hypothetical protein
MGTRLCRYQWGCGYRYQRERGYAATTCGGSLPLRLVGSHGSRSAAPPLVAIRHPRRQAASRRHYHAAMPL